ncbi:MAG: RnfH family protein [Burkholderiales bacterium]|nr:RnfH family protein [Burkholderiales bacterium]
MQQSLGFKDDKYIQIEVAYATPDKQIVIPLNIANSISIIEAICLSGIEQKFSQLDLFDPQKLCVGIFGKKIDINTYVLQANDRIEIYRPLAKTPNERRLERAKNSAK